MPPPWVSLKACCGELTRAKIPGNRNSADYQRHRFPGVTLEGLRERAARLANLLDRFAEVRIQQRTEDIFEIRTG